MKVKGFCCGLLVCVFAMTSYAEEPLATFAKQFLGLDLASVPFGQSAQTNLGYGASSTPLETQFNLCDDPAVTWVTNSASIKYHQEHKKSDLRYAVKDGRIVGARVSINSLQGNLSSDENSQTRKELRQIEAELAKVRKLQKESSKTASFELQTGYMCGSGESLFLMELQFTPAGKRLGSGAIRTGTLAPVQPTPASKNSSQ